MAIKRIWHGWTTKPNADEYQKVLQEQVLPSIEAKHIPGYKEVEVLRMELDDEVEFITIMTFESIQNIIDFQGEKYQKSYVPEVAQRFLKHWDLEATHYELIETRYY